MKVKKDQYIFYNIKPYKESKKYSLVTQIFLENILRHEGENSPKIQALLKKNHQESFQFYPSRILMQDFTGVPAMVDLATMRDYVQDPKKVNPKIPVDLVIDHSLIVETQGHAEALKFNIEKEYEKNKERYAFLKWAQSSFDNFKLVPPGTGICHQVNLEYLSSVVFNQENILSFETLLGTDSHTTMINGLGILGFGVGGIEAEAAMLGLGMSLTIPKVLGVKLVGILPKDTFATDLVLTVTEALRKKGVVGTYVEFFGPALNQLPLPDRATIANMAPEYGATCGIFPIDEKTYEYLELTNRSYEEVKKYVEWQDYSTSDEAYEDILEIDLTKLRPSISGPKRPQDRLSIEEVKEKTSSLFEEKPSLTELDHGTVVLAAITSCTNTSNPEVMIAAGLMAKKAVELNLTIHPRIKTSFAPGSQVVTDYLVNSGLQKYLDQLGFHLVGYGCTTCIGNSGPLKDDLEKVIEEKKLKVAGVLSGNRNFEGRIHPRVQLNYLASPPLVIAYALVGHMLINFYEEKIQGKIFLQDLLPSKEEIKTVIDQYVHKDLFKKRYSEVFKGDEFWNSLPVVTSQRYSWNQESSYIKKVPFFDLKEEENKPLKILALFGDSITTDHISPAGSIAEGSPAGQYLLSLNVAKKDFNSYGARRGNYEVMQRGTFANIRLKNELVTREGGYTLFNREEMTIYEASLKREQSFIVIAGKEYGTGSSRDWAAKGPLLLGVKVVLAESFERIHRSNLIGMGILPLQFLEGDSRKIFTGEEEFFYEEEILPKKILTLNYKNKTIESFLKVLVRIDTEQEFLYFKNKGILPFVLKDIL